MFYKDVNLFGSQATLNKVNALCAGQLPRLIFFSVACRRRCRNCRRVSRRSKRGMSYALFPFEFRPHFVKRASMKGLICGSGLTMVLRGGIEVPIHSTEVRQLFVSCPCGDVVADNTTEHAHSICRGDRTFRCRRRPIVGARRRERGRLPDSLPYELRSPPSSAGNRTDYYCERRRVLRDVMLKQTVQGKGYPDLATRQLISTLSNNLPSK